MAKSRSQSASACFSSVPNSLKVCAFAFLNFVFAQLAFSQEPLQASYGNSYQIDSSAFGQDVTLYVHLPAGYADSSDKDYPVLYVLDAESWMHAAVEANRILQVNRRIPETIIVGVVRTRLLGSFSDPIVRANLVSLFRDDVLPHVQANYRTSDLTTAFGHSATADLVLSLLIADPNLFSRFVLASPGLGEELISGMESLLSENPLADKTMYLTLTNIHEEGHSRHSGMTRLIELLNEKADESFVWRYDPIESLSHFTTPHTALFEGVAFLDLDFSPTRFADYQSFLEFGGLPEVESHYERRALKYGVDPSVPLNTIVWLAGTLIRENQLDEALDVLLDYKDVNPESTNMLSLFATVYQELGRYNEALLALEQANAIALRRSDRFLLEQLAGRMAALQELM